MAVSTEFSIAIPPLLMSGGRTSVLQDLLKQNSPQEATTPAKPVAGKRAQVKYHSHHLQPRVVQAGERIEAERKLQNTIETGILTNTEPRTTKLITPLLTMFCRRPHVYHTPALIIMVRHRVSHSLA